MRLSDKIVCGILAILVHTLFRPRLHYVDKEKQGDRILEPSIIVVNHTSHIDGALVNTVFHKNKIHSLAAKDRFEQKGFGFLLRHSNCIPIDRINPDISWVHKSLDVLQKRKECIEIFPEGRHGSFRQQLPFHPGVVMLAAVAQVPIVMIYVDGPFKAFGKRSELIVDVPFRMDPPVNGMNSDYINEQTHMLEERMKSLMNLFVERTTEK